MTFRDNANLIRSFVTCCMPRAVGRLWCVAALSHMMLFLHNMQLSNICCCTPRITARQLVRQYVRVCGGARDGRSTHVRASARAVTCTSAVPMCSAAPHGLARLASCAGCTAYRPHDPTT